MLLNTMIVLALLVSAPWTIASLLLGNAGAWWFLSFLTWFLFCYQPYVGLGFLVWLVVGRIAFSFLRSVGDAMRSSG